MRESHVEESIGRFCKQKGITYQKMAGAGNRGMADRLLMKSGIAAFLEIKAPGKEPTALQMRYLKQRRADGFSAAWVDNYEDAVKWISGVFGIS